MTTTAPPVITHAMRDRRRALIDRLRLVEHEMRVEAYYAWRLNRAEAKDRFDALVGHATALLELFRDTPAVDLDAAVGLAREYVAALDPKDAAQLRLFGLLSSLPEAS